MSEPKDTRPVLHRPWLKKSFAVIFLLFLGISFLAPLPTLAQFTPPESAPVPSTPTTLPAGATPSAAAPAATAPTTNIVCNNVSFSSSSIGDYAKCIIFQSIVSILQITLWFRTIVFTIVTQVLVAFASYNGFAHATIVETGWKIIRDLVNMFFIVVLLVSAFATIIGYDSSSFNYKNVLPKLLLMAVLINFSKTLIQLLIDFSQVVMLTFVNAFQAAAAGNFINAFRLTELTHLAEGGQASSMSLVQIIVSYMLANFMMAIILGLMIILTAYLAFRIVGLWLALIFSPFALFASALPGRIKKSLAVFADQYWTRLTSLLAGGPILAFFLWLTLATVQSSAASGGLAPAMNFGTSSVPQGLTAFFTSDQIASFIVATAILLMGLEAAVSQAGAISSTLGAFGGKIAGLAKSAGKAVATSPFLAAGAAGYGAYRAGRAGAGAVDRRLDVTGTLSRGALQKITQAQQRGGVIGAAAGAAGRFARPTLVRGATLRKREAETQGKAAAEQFSELRKYGGAELAQQVAKTYNSDTGPLRTLGERRASEMITGLAASEDVRKEIAKTHKSDHVPELKKQGLNDEDAKASSGILANQDALAQQRDFQQKQYDLAKNRGDKQEIERLDQLLTSNPQLAAPGAQREEAIKKLSYLDPDAIKGVDDFNANNGEVLSGLMENNGWEENKATGAMELKDDAAWDRAKRSVKQAGNNTLLNGMEAHEQLILSSPSQAADTFKNVEHRKNPKDGSMQAFTLKATKITTGKDAQGNAIQKEIGRGSRFRNDTQRNSFESLKTAGEQRASGGTVDALQMKNFVDSGGSLSDLPDLVNAKLDRVPLDDFAKQVVGVDSGDAAEAIKQGDSSQFNKKMSTVARVFSNLDQSGVDAHFQTQILSSFAQNGGAEIISNYDKLAKDLRPKVLKALEVAMDRVNHIKVNKAPAEQTPTDKALIGMIDTLSSEAEKKRKESELPAAVRTMIRKA